MEWQLSYLTPKKRSSVVIVSIRGVSLYVYVFTWFSFSSAKRLFEQKFLIEIIQWHFSSQETFYLFVMLIVLMHNPHILTSFLIFRGKIYLSKIQIHSKVNKPSSLCYFKPKTNSFGLICNVIINTQISQKHLTKSNTAYIQLLILNVLR